MTGGAMRSGSVALMTMLVFVGAAGLFFWLIGQPPTKTLTDIVGFAAGDAFSREESLLKAAPILLCALSTAIPGRLGLISVGADGQLHAGAIAGTALVLVIPDMSAWLIIPLMLASGAVGGAIWGLVPGCLRARLSVNETITTLVMNYIAVLAVNALVFGPWRDPENLGWPATRPFAEAARLPEMLGTRVHLGLWLGVVMAIGCAVVFQYGIRAERVRVLAANRKVGETFGLNFPRHVIVLMATGGAAAGLAGIAEVSAIQGRLQPGLSLGYGLTGFLIAWLCQHRFLAIIPASLLIGGLLAAGDALQLFAKVPASSATILQAILFIAVLAVPGLMKVRAT